jgi:hypothetical protein
MAIVSDKLTFSKDSHKIDVVLMGEIFDNRY